MIRKLYKPLVFSCLLALGFGFSVAKASSSVTISVANASKDYTVDLSNVNGYCGIVAGETSLGPGDDTTLTYTYSSSCKAGGFDIPVKDFTGNLYNCDVEFIYDCQNCGSDTGASAPSGEGLELSAGSDLTPVEKGLYYACTSDISGTFPIILINSSSIESPGLTIFQATKKKSSGGPL